MRSYRNSTQRSHLFTDLASPEGATVRKAFPVENAPAIAFGIELPLAGILRGAEQSNIIMGPNMIFAIRNPPMDLKPGEQLLGITIHPADYLRLLIKIGYSFAVAERGTTDGVLPLISDVILGKSENAPHLIGSGLIPGENDDTQEQHTLQAGIYRLDQSVFEFVQVRLFGNLGLPSYHVVVSHRPVQ